MQKILSNSSAYHEKMIMVLHHKIGHFGDILLAKLTVATPLHVHE